MQIGVCDMDVDQASNLVRQALLLALLVSSPLLVIGLVVGLIISLFQAVTQIQEQTLVFVPKIAAMVAIAIFVLPWITSHLIAFAREMFSNGSMP
jgi:flagellar biosynthesis protein FliQ